MMILRHHFFVRPFRYTGLLHCWDRHSGGGGGFTESPLSVMPVDWCIFAEDFMKKPGAEILCNPKKREIQKNESFMNPFGG